MSEKLYVLRNRMIYCVRHDSDGVAVEWQKPVIDCDFLEIAFGHLLVIDADNHVFNANHSVIAALNRTICCDDLHFRNEFCDFIEKFTIENAYLLEWAVLTSAIYDFTNSQIM